MGRVLPLSLVAAFIMSFVGGLPATGQVNRVAAQGMQDINAWIELNTTRPGVGCTVEVSVEVRSSGQPVTDVDVALAIFVGEEFISSDRAVTNENGVAYLSLDTSAAWSGANGWLDINVASTYLTGTSIIPTDGGCSDAVKLIEYEGAIANVQVDSAGNSSSGPAVSVWVPTYKQQRNLSCEYASLYIATSAWGNGVSEYSFDEVVGWSENPHWGYRGDINGQWGNTTDYGVYAAALARALDEFGFYGDDFFAAGDRAPLTSRLDSGVPVVVWLGLWGDQSHYQWTEDGSRYLLVAGMHVLVAYGYDDDGVYLSDPGIGDYRFYGWSQFMSMWNVLDGMGLGVSPN